MAPKYEHREDGHIVALEDIRLPRAANQMKSAAVQDRMRGLVRWGDDHMVIPADTASLSQTGAAWVENGASLLKYASVAEDALILSGSTVEDRATVKGRAIVALESRVRGEATVQGSALVCERSTITQQAHVGDDAVVVAATIAEQARLSGRATVRDRSAVYGSARVRGNGTVANGSFVHDGAARCDGQGKIIASLVSDAATVRGTARISGVDRCNAHESPASEPRLSK